MLARPLAFGIVPLTLLLWLALSGSALARDYRIEVVLFENLEHQDSGAPHLYYPVITDALGLSAPQAAEAGFALVSDALTLADAAQRIDESPRHRLLRHFAWRQPGLDESDARPVRVNLGEQFSLYIPSRFDDAARFIGASAAPVDGFEREIATTTVNGTLTVSLGRFLHLDTLLVFTDVRAGRSYRLDQSRKMRSRELHYIDNPRFGLLARILPIEEPETPEESDPVGTDGNAS